MPTASATNSRDSNSSAGSGASRRKTAAVSSAADPFRPGVNADASAASTRARQPCSPAKATTLSSSSSSSSSVSLRAAAQRSLPRRTAASLLESPPHSQQQQQQEPPTQSLAVPVRNALPSHSLYTAAAAATSSSPPTPSPLSTSGSNTTPAAAPLAAPSSSSPGRGAEVAPTAAMNIRESNNTRRSNTVASASIQAASSSAVVTTATAETGTGMSGGDAQSVSVAAPLPKPAVSNSSGVDGTVGMPLGGTALPPPPPQQQTSSPTLTVEEEAAEMAKEVQRQQILAHANDLLTFCAISNKVTSIRQCTSSFFVLLYQRLFDCTIPGIDRSPNTAEKRRHNVMLVLEQLRQHPYSLADIAAEEVVRLNEDHISRLIMVFVRIAEDMRCQQQQHERQLVHAAAATTPPSFLPSNSNVMTTAAAQNLVMPEADSGTAGDDYRLARSGGGGGAYVPVGYTVAEVMPNLSAASLNAADAAFLQQQQQQLLGMTDGGRGNPYAALVTHAALSSSQHYRHAENDIYVAPVPPLNGSLVDPSGTVAVAQQSYTNPYANAMTAAPVTPYDRDESPSSVSYYLDSSAIPTDELLAEWYRNLVYPAAHTPNSDGSAMRHSTTTPSSEVQRYHRDHHHHHHHDGEDVFTTTSSSAPAAVPGATAAATAPSAPPLPARTTGAVDAAKPARSRVAAATATGRSRRLSQTPPRAQLNAHDIVRRFQRLEQELDAQEGRHRQAFVGEPLSPHKAAAAEQHTYTRLHRGLPVQSGAEIGKRDMVDTDRAAEHRPPSAAASTAESRKETPDESAAATPPLSYDQQVLQQRQVVAPPPPPPPRQPALHHRLAAEPPLTRQERDFLLHRPQQHRDAAQRDRKIERLRAARYLGDMQQLLRRRMRHEYDAQMSAMRNSLKESLRSAKAEKTELMRRVRDENERYRAAYATLMEAAANEAQVPARVMSRHTAQLADYYATSLQHSQAMCEALRRETHRRTRAELLQFAEEVSAWQQHFLL